MIYSQILWKAYQKFFIHIADKKIAIPYRINLPPADHDRRKGKSSPKDLKIQLLLDAAEQNFNLERASEKEIQSFMRKNKLGLDCSGFAYRLLNTLLLQINKGSLQDLGFPHVGRTDVRLLTSDEFTYPIQTIKKILPGDIIRFNSNKKILHCAVIIQKDKDKITFAHSASTKSSNGVQLGEIKIRDNTKGLEKQIWDNIKLAYQFQPELGDKVVRLKNLK